MDPDAIREFSQRRWDLVAREKTRARAERYRRGGPAACVAAAADLRERWRRLHPEGPSPTARARDYAHQVELARRLDDIADGLRRR